MINKADGFGFYFVLWLHPRFFSANTTDFLSKYGVDAERLLPLHTKLYGHLRMISR